MQADVWSLGCVILAMLSLTTTLGTQAPPNPPPPIPGPSIPTRGPARPGTWDRPGPRSDSDGRATGTCAAAARKGPASPAALSI